MKPEFLREDCQQRRELGVLPKHRGSGDIEERADDRRWPELVHARMDVVGFLSQGMLEPS